jgi:hypothetical protein
VIQQQQSMKGSGLRVAAIAAGVCGLASTFLMYWLVLPGIVLGAAAVVLGIQSRRAGWREAGSVAIALGVVAILAVPAFLVTADGAEDWGRDCALDPTHDPNC